MAETRTPPPPPPALLLPRDDADNASGIAPSDTTAGGFSADTDIEKQNAGPSKLKRNVDETCSSIDSGVGFGRVDEELLSWWQAAFYMIAYNISIGILALPKAFLDLGLVGGLIFLIPYAFMNYFTSKTVWRATQRYGLYSYPDILGLIFGRCGKTLGHVIQSLLQGFLMAVHVMAMRKAIVAISAPRYVVCGVWWTFLGAFVMFLCSLYRNLKDCAWLAMASCASILAATIITIVSVVSDGNGTSDHFAFLPGTFSSASTVGSGIASIVFAFTGHLAYPQIINEMQKPEDFPKALKTNATVQAVMYALSACVIYWYAGDAVKAPALDSATGILSKLAWGLAIPTVVVAGVLPGMMIIKNANRGFWGWRMMSEVPWENSLRARLSWTAIAAVLWAIAPIFAEVVPSFMGVVGVAGAFLGTWISMCFPALAWLRMESTVRVVRSNSDRSSIPIIRGASLQSCAQDHEGEGRWRQFWRNATRNARQSPFTAAVNIGFFVLGLSLCIFGAYGAIRDMIETEHTSGAMKPFSCGGSLVE